MTKLMETLKNGITWRLISLIGGATMPVFVTLKIKAQFLARLSSELIRVGSQGSEELLALFATLLFILNFTNY